MGKVKTEIQLLEVTKVEGEMYTNINCSWLELFSITRELVDKLAENSGNNASYNDVLDDLKELKPE